MKNLYVTPRGFIYLDSDNIPRHMQESREGIESVLLIKEPTHIVYDICNKHVELDAQEGDILIRFYGSTFETPIILVENKEWANNIIKYDEAEQRRKEEWAKKAAKNSDND